jgi:hypothetical protein
MTDKEALKLALGALKDLQLCTDDYYDCSHEASKKGDEAITALEKVLADPMREVQRLGQEIEQEPVAWMFQHDETGRMNYVSNDGVHNPTMFLEMNPRYALVCPLYITPPAQPPQRTEPTCPECKAEVLYECVACSSNNYPSKETT